MTSVPVHCPDCQGVDVVRYGKQRHDPQRYRCNSKVAGARSPEWEYAQKTLEKQGLLCMLEGRQTPIDTGAGRVPEPCG